MHKFDISKYWKTHRRSESSKKKMSDAVKLAYKTGRHKKIWLGKHLSKTAKRKLKISHIKLWKNIALRKKVDRTLTRWWEDHPNIKKKYANRMKKYFIEHPKMFKKFMEGGKTASSLDKKSKLGLVRSLGEQKTANFLYENRIKARYESVTLLLDGWLCTPDFDLTELNYVVEFYGGHPGSYKKKIIKNKLYKKYKIPVISITPAELRDLSFLTRLKKNKDYSWKKFQEVKK